MLMKLLSGKSLEMSSLWAWRIGTYLRTTDGYCTVLNHSLLRNWSNSWYFYPCKCIWSYMFRILHPLQGTFPCHRGRGWKINRLTTLRIFPTFGDYLFLLIVFWSRGVMVIFPITGMSVVTTTGGWGISNFYHLLKAEHIINLFYSNSLSFYLEI